AVQQLQPGDQVVFYTDGITEAGDPGGRLFGTDRLDRALANCSLQAAGLLDPVLRAGAEFAAGHPADDDRTLVVARVSWAAAARPGLPTPSGRRDVKRFPPVRSEWVRAGRAILGPRRPVDRGAVP